MSSSSCCCFRYKCNFIAIGHAIRTQAFGIIKGVREMDVSQIVQVLVSAILGSASIYSMMQNALLLAVGFMIVLYGIGILFDYKSNKIPIKEAKFVLVEQ